MARTRNLKPGFFKNDLLVSRSMAARILFAGLWTIADREGRLEDRPMKIKLEIFPGDNVDVDALLKELVEVEEPFIQRYEVLGKKYIQILKFKEHQNPHQKEPASSIPAPDMPRTCPGHAPVEPGLNPSPNHLVPRDKEDTREEFEKFWQAYPKQRAGSREKAETAYLKAINRSTPEEIHRGLLAYAGSDEVANGFAKGAAAWLNDDRWTTDYTGKKQNGQSRKQVLQGSKSDRARAALFADFKPGGEGAAS